MLNPIRETSNDKDSSSHVTSGCASPFISTLAMGSKDKMVGIRPRRNYNCDWSSGRRESRRRERRG
jgi:hypothetical protein